MPIVSSSDNMQSPFVYGSSSVTLTSGTIAEESPADLRKRARRIEKQRKADKAKRRAQAKAARQAANRRQAALDALVDIATNERSGSEARIKAAAILLDV